MCIFPGFKYYVRKLIKPGINSRVKGKIVKCHIKDPKVINEEEYKIN